MTPLFPFIQLEFTHSVGPPAGRYVVQPGEEAHAAAAAPAVLDELDAAAHVAGDEGAAVEAAPTATATATEAQAEEAPVFVDPDAPLPLGSADVLVVKVIGAPPPRARLFRRGLPSAAGSEAPRELSVTLVTVIAATQGFNAASQARDWLAALRRDGGALEAWVTDGIGLLNRAVSAYRACAADPYVVEVSRADPRTVRVGYGEAPQVVLGEWAEAVAVPPPPPPRVTRTVQLMPTQGMAAVLAGQTTVLESEELVLRALLDLRHDRLRGAAVGLQAGIELLLGEIAGEVLPGVVQQRVDALLPLRERARTLAAAARRGPLGEEHAAALQEIAEAAGELIDQRRYAPMGF